MIPRLRGWAFQLLPDGFAMTHPEGAPVAVVHYRERVHPVRRVEWLARDVLAGWSDLAVDSLGPCERLTTIDGEHAAIVSAVGREHGKPIHRTLGFVLTDDFYSATTITCRVSGRVAEAATTLRDLVQRDVHALGIRRRRYEYEPPATFQPVRQSLITEWIPPDYPRNGTTICVYPAMPRVGFGTGDLGRVPPELAGHGYHVASAQPIVELSTRGGLAGVGQQIAVHRPGEPSSRRMTALLADDRYVYPSHVVCRGTERWDEMREVFLGVVDSICPVSKAPIPSAPMPMSFHWID